MTYIYFLSGYDVKWMSFNLHENDLHWVDRRQRSDLCQHLIQKLHISGKLKSDVILISASDMKMTFIHFLSGKDIFWMSFDLHENDLQRAAPKTEVRFESATDSKITCIRPIKIRRNFDISFWLENDIHLFPVRERHLLDVFPLHENELHPE